jgi:hypothetical protein
VSTKASLIPSDWKVENENAKKRKSDHQQGDRQKEKRASAASSAVIFSAGVVLIR